VEYDSEMHVMPRSILGSTETFEQIHKAKEAEKIASHSPASSPKMSASASRSSTKRNSMMRAGRVSNNNSDEALKKKRTIENPYLNPKLYLSLLEEEKIKVKKREADEKVLDIEDLKQRPFHEQLILTKESKVLLKWQQRQKEWERIQKILAKKISSNLKLMMNSERLNEFRTAQEKSELQLASIPPEDLYAANNWVMGLRGGGRTMTLSIGHIFSGLQCELKTEAKIPPIIRKPNVSMKDLTSSAVGSYTKSVSTLKLTKSALSASSKSTRVLSKEVLLSPEAKKRQNKLEQFMKTARPHEVTTENADTLFVKSIDLFDWAIESTKEYFETLSRDDDDNQFEIIGAEPVVSIVSGGQFEESSVLSLKRDASKTSISQTPSLCMIQFHSPREVVISSFQNKSEAYEYVMKNTGTVSVQYSWIPDAVESEYRTDRKTTEVSAMLFSRLPDEYSREKLLALNRPRFFCKASQGYILPGETISTPFTFLSQGCSGAFSQNWRLHTIPQVTVAFSSSDGANNAASSTSIQIGSDFMSNTTPVKISLHGQAFASDESDNSRNITRKTIDDRAIHSFCYDIVDTCVRKVRNPLRKENINARKYALFEDINHSLLKQISKRFGNQCEFYLTSIRINSFIRSFHNCNLLHTDVMKTRFDLRKQLFLQEPYEVPTPVELAGFLANSEEELENFQKLEDIQYCEKESTLASRVASINMKLFPEGSLECYDEISTSDLKNSWDYDVDLILQDLRSTLQIIRIIYGMEELLAKRQKAQAKALAKAARIKARLAAIDSDEEDDGDAYEDEEEEEEEPEEDEEAAKIDKATMHPLFVKCNCAIQGCYDLLNSLVVRPIPVSVLHENVSAYLTSYLRDFESIELSIRKELTIDPSAQIPSIVSPFTTTEGRDKWQAILDARGKPAVVDPKAKDKGKDKKAPAAAVGAVDPETADNYHAQLYTCIYEGLLSSIEAALCCTDTELTFASSATAVETNSSNLQLIAAVRGTDISKEDGMVFTRFSGEAFISVDSTSVAENSPQIAHPYLVHSAYNEIHLMKNRALQPIINCVLGGATKIVLVHESPVFASSLIGSINDICDLLQSLSPQMPLPNSREQRARDRQIRRRERYIRKANKALAKAQRNLRRRETPIEEDNRLLSLDPKDLPAIDPYPPIFTYHVIPCKNIAELEVTIREFPVLPIGTVIEGPRGGPLCDQVPTSIFIFLLEDMASPGICPAVPEYHEEESDDEEGVITVGYQEYKDSRLEAFRSAAPYRIDMPVQFCANDGSNILNETLRVLTDKHIALNEVFSSAALSSNCMWLETSPAALFIPPRNDTIFRDKNVLVSDQVREAYTWCGVINALPQMVLAERLSSNGGGDPFEAPGFITVRVIGLYTNDLCIQLSSGAQSVRSKWSSDESLIMIWDNISPLNVQAVFKQSGETFDSASFELADLNFTSKATHRVVMGQMSVEITHRPSITKASCDFSTTVSFTSHLRRLFPTSAPRFAVYVGGSMTSEKIRVIDNLLNSVYTFSFSLY
jgi:hypothetical protein